MLNTDTIVIGSGLAGLSCALHLANFKKNVLLISKKELTDCNSYYAQGGIAAVIDNHDSVENHVNDTLVAGALLCNQSVVKQILKDSQSAVEWLISLGVPFTKDTNNGYHLTQEGGHSFRRIMHADDITGKAIIDTMLQKVKSHPYIKIASHHLVVDLIVNNNECSGVVALNCQDKTVSRIYAHHTIIATGGAGKVYLYTTNPDTATGDGIALAYNAGANIANMEFMQFHPTCLFHYKLKSFLISEAVRGEGGILKLPHNGYRFMLDHDSRAELAPRDIVARAIDFEMKKHGVDCVHLDISYKPRDFIVKHFPNIYNTCMSVGIDITKEPIPVVPAAHYTCGGIVTDIQGRTNVDHLYAVGECAHTGLHGANRLASNSLLECLVIGKNATDYILQNTHTPKQYDIRQYDNTEPVNAPEEIIITHNWDQVRRIMWDYVGIVRSNRRLEMALHKINLLSQEVMQYNHVSASLIELKNLLINAKLIITSALMRHESRGLHYSIDYKDTLNKPKDTIVSKDL